MNRPTKRARTPRGNPPPNTVVADPSQWSEQSQGSVSAGWTHSYTDLIYRCRRCQAETLFSAADQKYTYEVKKAPIDQQRSLCQPCWSESHQIARTLKGLEGQWAQSKTSLRTDKDFLARWLQTIELRERYGLHRHDVARKNMLRNLLSQP